MAAVDRFSAQTTKMLIDAGWRPQRNVEAELKLPRDFEIFPSALEVLREFGNLTIGDKKIGEVLNLDPFTSDGDYNNFIDTAAFYGVEALYPLGVTCDVGCDLGIDPRGRVFAFGVGESYIAGTFDRALDALLLNMICWPICANPVEEREKLRRKMRSRMLKT